MIIQTKKWTEIKNIKNIEQNVENIETCKLSDKPVICIKMTIVERIIDYIKSWLYYPTMKKYFDDRKMSDCNHWRNRKFARFEYAWWHCYVGKLK